MNNELPIADKLQAILESNIARWQGMSKEDLIKELYNEMDCYLCNEIDQDNTEYIDELYEEVTP